MIVLDGTVVNVALPSIQSDLGFSQASLAWVINGYLIAFGGLLLLAGRLGDLIGTKRVFIAGLLAFTLASAFCGVAWNQPVLIAARFLQGVAGAMTSSVILAMIFTMFTEPQQRARAMGIFSFTASAGGSVGLLIGGTITQFLNWHWVFLINVPIGICAFLAGRRYLQDTKGVGLQQGADALGAALITACLMLAVYTVVEIPNEGLTSARTLLLGAIAVVLLVAFLTRQATAAQPLVDLSVFKSRNITGSNVLQVCIVAGMFGFFFLDSLYLRRVLGYGPVATGLAFLPVTLSIGAFSLGWSAQLAQRFGAHAVVIGGCVLGLDRAWGLCRYSAECGLPYQAPGPDAAARHWYGRLVSIADAVCDGRVNRRELGPHLGAGQYHRASGRRIWLGDSRDRGSSADARRIGKRSAEPCCAQRRVSFRICDCDHIYDRCDHRGRNRTAAV